jgi:hypothetical protein
MKVKIPYRFLEDNTWCVKEYGEWYPYADDATYEFDVDEVEFDYADLEQIVDEYIDDVIDILLSDEELTKALLKALKKRKTEVAQK